MRKLYTLLLAVCLSVLAMAQEKEKFELGKPDNDNYRYLDEYDALKCYIDYSKYPNFKLGGAIDAKEYVNNSLVRNLINKNFTETVAGNAMKMSSCVDANGNMNFTTVKNYVNAATQAGLNVYGHTLAWHSQQPIGWFKKLLADKPDPSAGEAWTVVASKNFRTDQSIGWHSSYDDYGYSISFDATNGLKVHCTKVNDKYYSVQFVAMNDIAVEAGKTYKMTITIRGTVDGKMHSKMGDWDTSHSSSTCPSFYFSTDWQDIEVSYTPELDNNFLLLQCGDYVGDIYIKFIKFEGYKNVTTIPLTQQERHDTLVYAMDKWIKGMMDACQGKVKAWDLINEAISGGGDDGNGNYVLQHSDSYNSGTWDVGGDAFYWQDHMGDLEYVRQACRLARKYGPEDIVLFINDYNLESSWDDNKKLKSLINWIKKWESDGVTRIDGIGTQMHISYYEKSSTQTRKKSAITNMFTLMAATGKYVRVSEMDMGYIDSDGNSVPTADITEAQHKSMADFYEWIIKEYLRIVPPAQQWGICQWCVTDSKTDSGWRKNTPVGIWDINYYRKHAYAGFVRGLGGVSSGVEWVAQDKDSPKAIYNLFGQRLSATSPDELPTGIYIIDNRKVVIR